ncbi:hypothetical protein C349_07178 [Cryptococcus neoformans var. grubii Br795]|nr:hypothetical protein C349_07178 [Cryptococcus neoformans var. grubii Br795]
MSSAILPYPTQPPYPLSRASTPRPTATLSAPPTPITPTHLLPVAMERARSTEGVVNGVEQALNQAREIKDDREPKSTRLKFEWEHIERPEVPESDHGIDDEEGQKMDVDEEQLKQPPCLGLGEPISAYDEERAQREDAMVRMDMHYEEAPPPVIWGMPKWGCEAERQEVAKGVRLLGMEELPQLVKTHSLIDTPSSVMFPWLHGISDDGRKGQEMAQFFGYSPPFEPPPYRGLCLLFCPPHPLDKHYLRPPPQRNDTDLTTIPTSAPYKVPDRKDSESESTSSESYNSSGATELTSPSLGNSLPSPSLSSFKPLPEADTQSMNSSKDGSNGTEVAMHPCYSKRLSPTAVAKGLDEDNHPLPCSSMVSAAAEPESRKPSLSSSVSSSSSDVDETVGQNQNPSCILFNALHVHDIFDLSKIGDDTEKRPSFRAAKLPDQINLRNLNIQQIKYATVSDIVLYSKTGLTQGLLHVAEQIAQAQEDLYNQRLQEIYHVKHTGGDGEGLGEPIRYGVWVIVESFNEIEKHYPELVNIDSKGRDKHPHLQTDLFEREAKESREMTKASEVVEGFWVGNDCDVPGATLEGAGSFIRFDLCLKASECSEMPGTSALSSAYRKLLDIDRRRREAGEESQSSSAFNWTASPATHALRNLLSPSSSSVATEVPSKRTASPAPSDRQLRAKPSLTTDHEYVALDCAGSSRTITGHTRNMVVMTDRVIELVYFLRKLVEGRDNGKKRKILVHCQDGYTESSIIVLAYIMSSLSISLPEAFVHLQVNANRSFFLYPADKPLLRKVDARLAADRKAKAIKLLSATNAGSASSHTDSDAKLNNPSPRWRPWGMNFGAKREQAPNRTSATGGKESAKSTAEIAREMLAEQENGGSVAAQEARSWFDDKRFDGFPSRILPFLYLGNLEHAGNAAMLHSLGITHVVSVGESLMNMDNAINAYYGHKSENTLAAAVRAGKLSVLDLTDVRDDGNDPLRPVIARACEWIEEARARGGRILVHCRVGVSRSASIVIAYMMQYEHMRLMDAYMVCRARRLNVLIQPNLRFFHELFGWEVELAKREAEAAKARREEAEKQGVRDPEALKLIEGEARKIIYSWPSFCRDLYCLNRRFLCN